MKVMVSYSRYDSRFTDELVAYLGRRKIKPWFDRQGIVPGQPWRTALLEQLRLCDVCVVILSPSYLASEHCRMEVFIARSSGALILPIMAKDCFSQLRDHEETKGLEDIFMMRMYRLSAVGLPITKAGALERVATALTARRRRLAREKPVYVSYAHYDGEFATSVARELTKRRITTWVATLDIRVGENWRDAQARAMLRAGAHVVVLGESMLKDHVLRTELLLAESSGLDVFTILPPRLTGKTQLIKKLMNALDRSHQTYRRLTATQAFTRTGGLGNLADALTPMLRKSIRGRK